MAKRKELGRAVDDLVAEIKAAVLNDKARDDLAAWYARMATTLIVRRTRSGKGVSSDGGSLSQLKPLSRAYIERRRRSRLSAFTSAGKSNLTFTSELLGSMTAERRSAGSWWIVFKGSRARGLTNAKLAQYVAAAGRPFLYLAKTELAELERGYRRTFDDLVKRKNK